MEQSPFGYTLTKKIEKKTIKNIKCEICAFGGNWVIFCWNIDQCVWAVKVLSRDKNFKIENPEGRIDAK